MSEPNPNDPSSPTLWPNAAKDTHTVHTASSHSSTGDHQPQKHHHHSEQPLLDTDAAPPPSHISLASKITPNQKSWGLARDQPPSDPNQQKTGLDHVYSAVSSWLPKFKTWLALVLPLAPYVVGVPENVGASAQALMQNSLKGRSMTWAASWSGAAHQYAGFNWVRLEYDHDRFRKRRTPRNKLTLSFWLDALLFRPRRRVVQFFAAYKVFRVGSILIEMLIDFSLVCTYIAQITVDRSADREFLTRIGNYPSFLWTPRSFSFWLCIVILSFFNLLSFALRMYFSENVVHALIEPLSIVDFVTTGPAIVSLFIPNGQYLFLPYFLRAIHLIPRLRRFLHSKTEYTGGLVTVNGIRHKLIVQITTLICITFIIGCVFQYVEESMGDQALGGVEAMYFAVVSMTTVGYGDVVAKSSVGRLVVIFGIIVGFIAIPPIVNSVVETYRAHRAGGGTYERQKIPHVVVIGHFDSQSFVASALHAFFFNENSVQVHVIFLARQALSPEVKTLISAPIFRSRVFYIQGSALKENDLIRADIRNALAVFIIDTGRTPEEDERNVLRVWSVAQHAPHVELYVHTNQPDYDRFHAQHATAVVCAEDLKQALLGCNCLHRGVVTLITNLMNSTTPLETYASPWLSQYGDGLGNEIYNCPVNAVFIGSRFHHVAAYLYCEFQVMAIGVRIPMLYYDVNVETKDYPLILNPASNYVLRGTEDIVCISQGPSTFESISDLTRESYEKSLAHHPAIRKSMRQMGKDAMSEGSRSPNKGSLGEIGTLQIRRPTLSALPSSKYRLGCPMSPFTTDRREIPLCHLLSIPPGAPADIEVASVCSTPGSLDSNSHPVITDHVVIITPRWQLFRLMCTMRSGHISADDLKMILFLSKDLPSDEEFQYLSEFPMVRYMRGDPRHRPDLLRANIHMAYRILILGPNSDDPKRGDDFNDLEAILRRHVALKTLAKMDAPHVYTMVEINSEDSIDFLGASTSGLFLHDKPRVPQPPNSFVARNSKHITRGKLRSTTASARSIASDNNKWNVGSSLGKRHSITGSVRSIGLEHKWAAEGSQQPPIDEIGKHIYFPQETEHPGIVEHNTSDNDPTINPEIDAIEPETNESSENPRMLNNKALAVDTKNLKLSTDQPPTSPMVIPLDKFETIPVGIVEAGRSLSDTKNDSKGEMGHNSFTARRRTRRFRSTPGFSAAADVDTSGDTADPSNRPTEMETTRTSSANYGYHIGYPPPPRRLQRFYDPLFASGEAFVADMLNTILVQQFLNPVIVDFTRLFSGIRSYNDIKLHRELNLQMSFLYTENVPGEFVACSFGDLFLHYCLEHRIVVLGLYRAPCSELGNTHSFVWCCPVPEAILKEGDIMYVLKPQDIKNNDH